MVYRLDLGVNSNIYQVSDFRVLNKNRLPNLEGDLKNEGQIKKFVNFLNSHICL